MSHTIINILKALGILIGLFVVVIIAVSMYLAIFEQSADQVTEIRENCRKLEVGMSREEVRAIMGDPLSIRAVNDNPIFETWVYTDGRLVSTQVTCKFDVKTGKLLQAKCED